jgi:hypothetical protein
MAATKVGRSRGRSSNHPCWKASGTARTVKRTPARGRSPFRIFESKLPSSMPSRATFATYHFAGTEEPQSRDGIQCLRLALYGP